MDVQMEAKILERLDLIEDRLKKMEGRSDDVDSSETVRQKVIDLVESIDGRSLTRLLREINKNEWAGIFYGFPRRTMGRVKASVSKNSWVELVESWRLMAFWTSVSHQRDFLHKVRQMEEMGEIVLARAGHEDIDVMGGDTPVALKQEIDWEKIRAENVEREKAAKVACEKWMFDELTGLA